MGEYALGSLWQSDNPLSATYPYLKPISSQRLVIDPNNTLTDDGTSDLQIAGAASFGTPTSRSIPVSSTPYSSNFTTAFSPVNGSSIRGTDNNSSSIYDDGSGNIYTTYDSSILATIDYSTGTVTDASGGAYYIVQFNYTYPGSLPPISLDGSSGDITSYGRVLAQGVIDEGGSEFGVQIGIGGQHDSPRFWLGNGTPNQNWQIDNFYGTMRFFIPGTVQMQMVPATVTGTTAQFQVNGDVYANNFYGTLANPTFSSLVNANGGITSPDATYPGSEKFGDSIIITGINATANGYGASSASNGFAGGYGAMTTDDSSVSVGANTYSAKEAVATGYGAYAANYALANGYGAYVGGIYSMGFGHGAYIANTNEIQFVTNDSTYGNVNLNGAYVQLDIYNGVADFQGNSVKGASIIKSGGTSTEFLKADGSVDSTTYLPYKTKGTATLVSGTKAITISGLTSSNQAFVQLVTPSGTLGAMYKAVCTTNTLTITAVSILGVTVTTDTSTLNYLII